MQADEFEKKIQSQMEGFELIPDREVWDQVRVRIQKEKKKQKELFYLVFTLLALLSVTSALWFSNNENKRSAAANRDDHHTLIKRTDDRKYTADDPSHVLKQIETRVVKNKTSLKQRKLKGAWKAEAGNYWETNTTPIVANDFKDIPNDFKDMKSRLDTRLPDKQASKRTGLPPHKFYNPTLTVSEQVDVELKPKTIDANTNIGRVDTIAKEINLAKPQNRKKIIIGVSVYSGISNNLSTFPLLEKNHVQESYSSPGSSQSGNYSNYSLNTSNGFKNGFSFGLGISLKKQLSDKISLSSGINYHLYSAKTRVGRRENSTRSLFDSVSQTMTLLDGFYDIGNSVNYLNKYQLVQLPVNLGLQLNKNQAKPLELLVGLSPGYMLGSNALYANRSLNVYYVDKEMFNRLQLSGQIGLSVPVINSYKYLLTAGPLMQFGFTSATKAKGAAYHLFFTGLKVNMSLK